MKREIELLKEEISQLKEERQNWTYRRYNEIKYNNLLSPLLFENY